MGFYSIVQQSNSTSGLEDKVNSELARYSGVTVSGFDISFGNDKNHASLLLEADSNEGLIAEVNVKCFNDKDISVVNKDIEDWIDEEEQLTIKGLSLFYDKVNHKYKAMVLYDNDNESTEYEVEFEKEKSDADFQDTVQKELLENDAIEVVGYSYTFCQKSNVALYIYKVVTAS